MVLYDKEFKKLFDLNLNAFESPGHVISSWEIILSLSECTNPGEYDMG